MTQHPFPALLDRLNILPGDVVYLHTSFGRLAYLNLSAEALIAMLLERLGESGTLAMPCFAWNLDSTQRPWKGYRDYFETRPVFDVRLTPANIGFLPEQFRHMPQVKRSVSYWWSITASGRLADVLTENQESILHYYGEGSSFDLLYRHNVKILGLGVTLNTNSLVLIPDYHLRDVHTQTIFSDTPQQGTVINHDGKEIITESYWLLPDVVRLIKPEVLFQRSARLQQAVFRADEGDIIQFAYPYRVYHDEALRLGKEACSQGKPVPWLENYPLSPQNPARSDSV